MGIFDIFGKSNKDNYYDHLLNLYSNISHIHNLQYRQYSIYGGVFQVMARYGPSPWPGIKVHTPLSDKIYNVLTDQNFQDIIIHGEIDGIKIFKVHSHKQVTFYISFHYILGYKKLLDIFRKHKIEVKVELDHDNNGNVLLNRMYISKDIFVRYSTDFNDRKKDPPKADDSKWRDAEEYWKPKILAVRKSYLLKHLYNLNYKDNSHIITFLTLKDYNGLIVPIPNIILSLSSNKLITYNIYKGITEYDLSTEVDYISDNPEDRLRAFLGQNSRETFL